MQEIGSTIIIDDASDVELTEDKSTATTPDLPKPLELGLTLSRQVEDKISLVIDPETNCISDQVTCTPESQNHRKIFRCIDCSYVSLKKRKLHVHCMKKHKGPNFQYECWKCNFVCNLQNQFDLHLDRHISVEKESQALNVKVVDVPLERERSISYTCNLCDYVTDGGRDYDNHLCYHMGEEVKKCLFCDYSTYSSKQFNNHLSKTHKFNEAKMKAKESVTN